MVDLAAATQGERTSSRQTVVVRGLDRRGRAYVEATVAQGEPPRRALRRSGFRANAARGARWESDERFVIEFEGFPASWSGTSPASGVLSAGPASVDSDCLVRQRLAAYGLVYGKAGDFLTEDCLLLTSLTNRLQHSALWILPGGGLDREEDPEDALIREAWEEAGQQVAVGTLRIVISGHRVGPTASGVHEDFHAIRLVFDAVCERPTAPVVYDTDGSTAEAIWWPISLAQRGEFPGPLAPWVIQSLHDAGLVTE